MATKPRLRFLYVLPTFFTIIAACHNDELYSIKSTVNQYLVLDGTESSQIKLRDYTGTPSQLWSFEKGDRVELFYIVNNQTGKVLDYHPGQHGWLYLVAKEKTDVLWQQWTLGVDGRITNAENKRNIDVFSTKLAAETSMVVAPDNGTPTQEFRFVRFHFVDLLIPSSLKK